MKAVLAGPAKAIFAACASDPKIGMRPLHWFRKHRHVLIVVKLALKTDRLVRPRLQHHFDAFIHALGGFLLIDAELFVLMRFAAFADAEIQPAVGNDVDHRIGLGHLDRVDAAAKR